jgi:diguanylate cyclase (GGDEF)-like protein
MLSVNKHSRNDGSGIPLYVNGPIGADHGKDAEPLLVDSRNRAAGILRNDIKLPSPPAVAIRILEAFKNENVSVEEISRIVSSDPALAVKVLKLANSPVYTRSGKIETIRKAVAVLGMRTLKNIALSFVIVDGIRSRCSVSFDLELFWRKSITSAVATSLISGLLNKKDDDLFITALLQDIGVLILHLHDAETYNALMSENDPGSLIKRERAAFGLDHQETGAWFLKKWGLPGNICELVRCHHTAESVPEPLLAKLNVLRLSNSLSSVFHAEHSGHDFEEFTQSLRSVYAASKEDIERVIDSAHQKTSEVLSFFELSPGSMKTCPQILQEANEELGKLNMTYEQLVLELRQAKEEADQYALKLSQANEKLQQLAYRDSLTGLFNHGHFQDMLDREIQRATRYRRPFSLLLLDLDHFKGVNDSYGHLVGDGVLRTVSELASKSVRRCDYVARYGGEEFAIILPETGAAGATTLGERIRKAIETAEIAVEGHIIKTTISIGAYTYRPGESGASKPSIIAAADRALYVSKSMGRNRMSVSTAEANV